MRKFSTRSGSCRDELIFRSRALLVMHCRKQKRGPQESERRQASTRDSSGPLYPPSSRNHGTAAFLHSAGPNANLACEEAKGLVACWAHCSLPSLYKGLLLLASLLPWGPQEAGADQYLSTASHGGFPHPPGSCFSACEITRPVTRDEWSTLQQLQPGQCEGLSRAPQLRVVPGKVKAK